MPTAFIPPDILHACPDPRQRAVWFSLLFAACTAGTDHLGAGWVRDELSTHSRDLNTLEIDGLIMRFSTGRKTAIYLPIRQVIHRTVEKNQLPSNYRPKIPPIPTTFGKSFTKIVLDNRRSTRRSETDSRFSLARASAHTPSGCVGAPHTTAPPPYDPHPFTDDGSSICARCPLPRRHRVHNINPPRNLNERL